MMGDLLPAIPAENRAYVAIWPASGGKSGFHFVSGEKLFRYGLIKGRRFPDPLRFPPGPDETNYEPIAAAKPAAEK